MADTETPTRLRIKVACEECRKGKRKCDGQKPTCSLCQKSGRICVFAPEPSRKRNYPDDEIIRNLQSQVEFLKNELKSVTGSQFEDSFAQTAGDPVQGPPLVDNDSTTDYRSPLAMEELASLMLKVDIEDLGEPSFTILAREAPVPIAAAKKRPSLPLAATSSPEESEFRTAELEIRRHLIGCFMQTFNKYHQFLDLEEAEMIIASERSAEDIDLQFRNDAIFAVASCLSPRIEVVQAGDFYATSADNVILQCIRETPNDLIVQGLSLLSWRELMFGTPSMAYNYIAMATGQILHLGLHVAATLSPVSQGNEALYRRRVRSFWAYFTVDRIVTSTLGMNCTMHWQRVKPPPYSSTVMGELSVNDLAHDRFCKLWHLWDSCMDQCYAFGWTELDRSEKEALVLRSHTALVTFHKGNHERLELRKDYMPDTVVWYHLAYHTALILVHRPLLNEPKDSSAGRFSLQSATTAAASITRILRAYRKGRNLEDLGPHVFNYILSAAVIHLLNATSGRTALGRQSANGIRACLEALSEMQGKWSNRAHQSIKHIRELAHRWEVIWALPIQFSEPLMPVNLQNQPMPDNMAFTGGFMNAAHPQGFNIFSDVPLDAPVVLGWDTKLYPSNVDYSGYQSYSSNARGQNMSYLEWLFDGEG